MNFSPLTAPSSFKKKMRIPQSGPCRFFHCVDQLICDWGVYYTVRDPSPIVSTQRVLK